MKKLITILMILIASTILTNAQTSELPDLKTLINNGKGHTPEYYLHNANSLNKTQLEENLSSQEKNQYYYLDSLIQYDEDNDFKYVYNYNSSMQLETELTFVFFVIWYPYMETDFSYYTDGNLKQKLVFQMNYETQQWDSAVKIDYLYDTNHFIEHETYYEYNNSLLLWVPDFKIDYSCDTNGYLLTATFSTYDTINTSWTYESRSNYHYNTNYKIFEYIYEKWNTQTNNWMYNEKIESNFDGLGYKTENIEYRFENNSWELAYKNEYVYNTQNYIVEDNRYNWDSESGAWVMGNFKSEFLYDDIWNMIQSNEFRWNDSSLVWDNRLSVIHDYNTDYVFNDLVLPFYSQVFDYLFYSISIPHPYYEFDYISHLFSCMLVSTENNWWQSSDSTWHTHDRKQFYYSDHMVSVPENMLSGFTVKVFPNPASNIVNLEIDNSSNPDLTLRIYNSIGKLVRSELLYQKQKQIYIGDLRNGIYFIEIKSKDWTETQKLIIQR